MQRNSHVSLTCHVILLPISFRLQGQKEQKAANPVEEWAAKVSQSSRAFFRQRNKTIDITRRRHING